jgi:hypothetical protein
MTMFKHAKYFKGYEGPKTPFNTIDEYLEYCACSRLVDAINKEKPGNISIRRKSNKEDPGYVYIAQAIDNHKIFKIGKSLNPNARMESLGFGHKWKLVKVVPCLKMAETESSLHYILNLHRKYGELFEITDFDIIEEAIDTLKDKLQSEQ